MSEEFLDPITPEGEPKTPGGSGTSNNKLLPIAAVPAIAFGTTPILDLLGI